jgi:hypothetical protein
MKRKMVWSMTALLAGAGFAAAQDVELTSGQLGNPHAALQTGQIVAVPQADCGQGGLCATGCSGYGFYVPRFYGSLDILAWRLGNSLTDSSSESLPSIRRQMPFGLVSRSVIVAPDGTTTTRDVVNQFGIAEISPVLFSGSNLDSQDRWGGRLTLGANMNDEWGAEMVYFQLERKGAIFTAGAGNIVEGFTNGLSNLVLDGLGGAVEEPTVFDPSVQAVIEGRSESRLLGFEGLLKHHAFTVGQKRVSCLFGGRFLELEEAKSLAQILGISDPVFVGSGTSALDFVPGVTNFTTLLGDYSARNRFYGFTVGARVEGDWSRFFYNATGKVSAGAVQQELDVNEFVFSSEVPGGEIPITTYPNPTVIHENRTRMAFVLEGTLNAGFRVTESLSIYAGYNVIVVSKIARPIEGSDLTSGGDGSITLNPGGSVNRANQFSQFGEQRFYAHGLNLGMEFRF